MTRRPDPDTLIVRFPEDWWVPPNEPCPLGAPGFSRAAWERVRDLPHGSSIYVVTARVDGADGQARWKVTRWRSGDGYSYVGAFEAAPIGVPDVFEPVVAAPVTRVALDYVRPLLGVPAPNRWVAAYTGLSEELLRAMIRAAEHLAAHPDDRIPGGTQERSPHTFTELSHHWRLARHDAANARAGRLGVLQAKLIPRRLR